MRVGDDYLLSSSPPNHPSKIKGKRFNLCSQVHPFPQAFGNEAGAPPGGPCVSITIMFELLKQDFC